MQRLPLKALLPILFFASSVSAADRPNILFIFTDDHAPHAIGAYDGWLKSVNPTPNIDQLAAQGTAVSYTHLTLPTICSV